jgi:hypothetical protein
MCVYCNRIIYREVTCLFLYLEVKKGKAIPVTGREDP